MQLSLSKVLDTSQKIVHTHWKPIVVLLLLNIVANALTRDYSGGLLTTSEGVNEYDVDGSLQTAALMGSFSARQILGMVLTVFVNIAAVQVLLKLTANKSVSTPDYLPSSAAVVAKVIGAQILVSLGTLVGFLLLIVPGVVFALTYSQVTNLIIDRNMGVMDAFKESARMMQGNRLNLLGIGIVMGLLTVVGMFLLLLPGLYMVCVTLAANVVTYRMLLGTTKSEAAVAEA